MQTTKTRNKDVPTNQIDPDTGNAITYRTTEKWIPMSERGGPSQAECAATLAVIEVMLSDLNAQIAVLTGRRSHLETARKALLVGERGD